MSYHKISKPIKIRINVTKVLREHIYAGKNGKYLDLVAWPNKNGHDQYGNTHMVCQELNREARDKGERGPILGNLTLPEEEFMPTGKVMGDGRSQRPQKRPAQPPRQQPPDESISDGMEEDIIPF